MRAVSYLISSAALIGLASAVVGDFEVDIDRIEPTTRSSWCTGERSACQNLCTGAPETNTCDFDTLEAECLCKNGTAPGLEYYDSSLYSFVCQEAFGQCNTDNAGDKPELDRCRDEILPKCGTLKLDDFTGASTETASGDSPAETGGSDEDDDSDDESTDAPGAAATAFPGMSAAVIAIGMLAALV